MTSDDDPEGSVISVTAGAGVTEGGSASFTVTADPAPEEAVTVTVTVTQTGDYAAAGTTGTHTVTIPTTGSAAHSVATTNDDTDESDGAITLTLKEGEGYTVSSEHAEASVAVADDDDPDVPEISVTAGSGITEGSSAAFTVTADPAPTAPLTVTVTVSQTGDFGAATGTATVNIPTTGSAQHTVATVGDEADEADGAVTVTVNAGTGYTVSAAQGAASVAVADDDDPPAEDDDQPPATVPEISVVAGSGITEGASASFTVSATPAPSAPLTVSVTVIESGDFGAAAGPATVVIPTGGSVTHTVATAGDSTDEPDGSLTLTLRAGSGYAVSSGRPAATLAVADDDQPAQTPPPVCRTTDTALLAQVAAKAGDPWNGARPDLVDTFGRAHATMLGTDTYTVAALKARPDRQSPNWQGAGPNALWQAIYAELDSLEACRATAQTPPPPAVVPQVSVTAGAGVTEGGSAGFTISASPVPSSALSVVVTVTQAGDFGAAVGAQAVVIPTGGTTAFSVATAGDGADEPHGSVTLTLNAGSGYTVSATSGSAAVAVSDDDDTPQDPDTPDDDPGTPDTDPPDDPPPPPVPDPDPEISVTAGSGITEGQSAAFTVSASPAPKTPLTVTVTVTQAGDFGVTTGTKTVVIGTGGAKTVSVATAGDSADEADGSVTLTVNTGSGYTVSSSQGAATVTVADDDVPEISVTAGPGITEGGSAVFTITASPAPAGPLTVTVTVAQTGDYGVTPGARTVVVPTGGAVKLAVATAGDNTDEPDGSVTLTANAGTGYTVSS
ncbi:MAG: hypothetical protein OXG09_05460, partial [Chloroflexi bacterium]|nr:hypothetical protein [Chloroflexota bacterium]